MRSLVVTVALCTSLAAACGGESTVATRPAAITDEAWGRQLFFTLRCATCHDVNGVRRTGPPLNGRWNTEVLLQSGERVPFDSDYLRGSLFHPGQALSQGYPPQMPSYLGLVSDSDVRSLEAYLRSLR